MILCVFLAAIPAAVQIAITVATAVATIASTVATTIQAQNAANAQKKAIEQQHEFERQQAVQRALEEREAAGVEKFQTAVAHAEAAGEVKSQGLQGNSAEAVLAQVGREAARRQDIINRNFEIGNRAAGDALTAAALNRRSRLSEVQEPSWLNAGLSIAGTALGAAGSVGRLGSGGPSVGSGLFGANNAALTIPTTNPGAANAEIPNYA